MPYRCGESNQHEPERDFRDAMAMLVTREYSNERAEKRIALSVSRTGGTTCTRRKN